MFPCKHCERKFSKFRSLGGHISKVHKGMSTAYKRKMLVRSERESKRMALCLAKQLLEKHASARAVIHRSKLTALRNIVLETRADDLTKTEPGTIKSDLWFQDLAKEILTSKQGSKANFTKVLSATSLASATQGEIEE